ncbi:DUF4105 domain-containing protein [Pirellulaceae bacterium SH467]
MHLLAWLFVFTVVLPTTLWFALAIHYHFRQPWLRIIASLAPLAVMSVSLSLLPIFPWVVGIWLSLMAIGITWWHSLRPKSDGDWLEGMKVLPQVGVLGNTLTINNFRHFSYSESGEAIPHYEERSFDLTRLSSIDYFLAHWSGPIIAHTLVSFGFEDGKFLCISVEARRERWQNYSPLWGLFRTYQLIFVVGDERDIIRLRTNIWQDKVYMYRLRLPREHLHKLLLDYVERINKLNTSPEWYNSVASNCTTNLFYQGRAKVPWWVLPRILLNGLSARAMYELGFLDQQVPFEELQSRCAIRERALAAGDSSDFSEQIRSSAGAS